MNVLVKNAQIAGFTALEAVDGYEVYPLPESIPPEASLLAFADGKVIAKTAEQLLSEKKESILAQLKTLTAQLLAPTDYIILKIQEAELLGQDTTPLREKYASQLQLRASIRSWNDQKKKLIQNATSLNELEAILLDDYPTEG